MSPWSPEAVRLATLVWAFGAMTIGLYAATATVLGIAWALPPGLTERMLSMFDVKKVIEEAEQEVNEERTGEAKKRVKSKLREIAAAKKVLANLERELEDLYAELGQNP